MGIRDVMEERKKMKLEEDLKLARRRGTGVWEARERIMVLEGEDVRTLAIEEEAEAVKNKVKVEVEDVKVKVEDAGGDVKVKVEKA